MPAVTVEDITQVRKVTAAAATARQRPVRAISDAPHGLEGEGFPVRRAFAGVDWPTSTRSSI